MWTTGHSLLREPKRENCFSDSGPNPVNRSGYRWADVQLQAQGRSISTYYYLVSIWLSDRLGAMPKRNLVLAEDCAGLGSLKESCKYSTFFLIFVLALCLFTYIQNVEHLLRLAGLQSHVYYASESDPKLLARLKKLYKPELVSNDAMKKTGILSIWGFNLSWTCWESKSTKQYKQIVQHS